MKISILKISLLVIFELSLLRKPLSNAGAYMYLYISTDLYCVEIDKTVQVGKDQEKAQSETMH